MAAGMQLSPRPPMAQHLGIEGREAACLGFNLQEKTTGLFKRQVVVKLALDCWMQWETGTGEAPRGGWVVRWVCVGVAIAAASGSKCPGKTSGVKTCLGLGRCRSQHSVPSTSQRDLRLQELPKELNLSPNA